MTSPIRHVIDLFDMTSDDILRVYATTKELKRRLEHGVREPLLQGHVMAMLFEKPSLRTRVSFETAMIHLGGSTLFLGDDVGWGKRESAQDFARVISEYVDVVICRTNSHAKVVELAKYSECPVVNGLTDKAHPCQALADIFTILEFRGSLTGAKLAYVGDSNNVARSLAVACGRLGVKMSIASPSGYQFDGAFLSRLRIECPQNSLEILTDPRQCVVGADAVYTDVWTSMGQEAERAERLRAFAAYQINGELMRIAPPSARFLHCLPAHRGEEVTDEVIDGPQSAVIEQAGNRMHVQKGLVAWLLRATIA